jgi:hypothetical protein
MNKRGKISMGILMFLLVLVLCCFVYFSFSGSPTKNEFDELATSNFTYGQASQEVFTLEDISHLPSPVQRYFNYCGFIGKPKMQGMKATFENVAFSLGRNKPTVTIAYTQYNAVKIPQRIAYIDTTMYGIPFEGLDAYLSGKGSMKGVLGKRFTLFDQKGTEMDSASLVTMLSECLFVPSTALEKYIVWEPMDETHAKATIEYYGITCSGIFTFTEEGAMDTFVTEDRVSTAMDGTRERASWTAHCGNYHKVGDLMLPSLMQASWSYSDGNLLYFDSDNVTIEYF